LNYMVIDFRGDEDHKIEIGWLTFGLTRLLLLQKDPRWIAIGLAARAGAFRLLFCYVEDHRQLFTAEMRELFVAARLQMPNPAEAQPLLEPYLRRTSVAWRDLIKDKGAPPNSQSVVERERSFPKPYAWRRSLLERVNQREGFGANPAYAPDYDIDEFDDEDVEEFREVQTDVRLQEFPPTTHLEAELLLDRVLEIADPEVRDLRLGELLALIDASTIKGGAMETLKRRTAEARTTAS